MLLTDITILENVQILNEGKNGGPMKIRGVFQRADEANRNKRIYPRAVLEREVERIAESVKNRSLLGELDHPTSYDNVRLSNVSHLITSLEMRGNEMIGEAEILPTPAGQVIKALIEGGVAVGISSRGSGSLSEDAQGNRFVNEDFKLTTFDMVADPSTRGAYPKMAESTLIESIVQETFEKASKEQVFITMLKSKLNEGSLKDPIKRNAREASRERSFSGTSGKFNKPNRFFHKIQRGKHKQKYIPRKENPKFGSANPGSYKKRMDLLKNNASLPQSDKLKAKLAQAKKRSMREGSLKDQDKRAYRERSRDYGRAGGGISGEKGSGDIKSKDMLDTYKKSSARRDGKEVTYGKHGIKRGELQPVSDKLANKLYNYKIKNISANESTATERSKEYQNKMKSTLNSDALKTRLDKIRKRQSNKIRSSADLAKEIRRMRKLRSN